MDGFPIKEFIKLPKWFRDKYLELAAYQAANEGMYGGQKMPVIKEIGSMRNPKKSGTSVGLKPLTVRISSTPTARSVSRNRST